MAILDFLSKAPPELTTLISYMPIGLFAESMRVNSALVRSIGGRSVMAVPLTGCIKDLNRLWYLTRSSLFEDDSAIVVSRRHGNEFPLVNSHLLRESGLIGRTSDESSIPQTVHRLTTLHITFIHPDHILTSRTERIQFFLIFLIQILLLSASCYLQIANGLYIGGALMVCMSITLIIQLILQHVTHLAYANPHALAQDCKLTAVGGAATDVHIIGNNFNASELDVLVGYSSQLHSLTNIPIRVPHWSTVRWMVRALVIILTFQAALLATLSGKPDKQAFGSMIWLFFYLSFQIPFKLQSRNSNHYDAYLHHQPVSTRKVPPLHFTGRRAALAFVATIPITSSQSGRWSWLDAFMPSNDRRRQWENELEVSRLLKPHEVEDAELGRVVEKRTTVLVEEVERMQRHPDYIQGLQGYLEAMKVVHSIGR